MYNPNGVILVQSGSPLDSMEAVLNLEGLFRLNMLTYYLVIDIRNRKDFI